MKQNINNLWDILPKEIIYIIWEYHYIPFIEDIKKTHILHRGRYWCDGYNSDIMSVYDWLDHKRSRRLCRALYGDVFFIYNGKTFKPEREYVIKMMKKNKLRIRRGMKTRTMIKHLIKM